MVDQIVVRNIAAHVCIRKLTQMLIHQQVISSASQVRIKLVPNRGGQRGHRGYGFLTFVGRQMAWDAVRKLNGKAELFGSGDQRALDVDFTHHFKRVTGLVPNRRDLMFQQQQRPPRHMDFPRHMDPPPLNSNGKLFFPHLMIGSVNFHKTEKEIYDFFDQFGQILEFYMVPSTRGHRGFDRRGRHQGIGFLTYVYLRDGEHVLNHVNQPMMGGRPMSVTWSNSFKGIIPQQN